MRVVIIGGGIGGLTTAIALERLGFDPHVYEQAPDLREIGAGIGLMANAVAALDLLGLGGAVRSSTAAITQGGVRNWRGDILMEVATDPAMGRIAVAHRAELLGTLAGAIDPSRLHTGHEFTGIEQDAGLVRARFQNGSAAEGDLLVGADGLRSTVRSRLFGSIPPRYAGYTAWRAVTKFDRAGMQMAESWGCGRRFGIVPLQGGRIYWFATDNAPEGERDRPGQARRELLDRFRGWHVPIEAVLEATEESAILRNDIFDLDPLSRWSDGRAILLGDAAHPMTPNLGQGACQAIEDAVVLAACLRTHSNVEAALAAYESRRRPRTREIVLQSRRFGQIAQWQNRLLCWLRDAAIRATPVSVGERRMKELTGFELLTVGELRLFG